MKKLRVSLKSMVMGFLRFLFCLFTITFSIFSAFSWAQSQSQSQSQSESEPQPLSRLQTQFEHHLIRRLTVFPIQAPKELRAKAEEAWWQARDILTENQKFLVASQNFLIQKDVFQARAELTPADAIILSKLLDAQALVTFFLENRFLNMRVYESDYGRLLWTHQLQIQPALPFSDQIVPAVRKLVYAFVSSVPYQGFVVVDPLVQKAIFMKDGKKMVKVDVGSGAQVDVGDDVQFLRLEHETNQPLFTPETPVQIMAEGKVVKIEREIMTVELTRAGKNLQLKEFSLVRLPRELRRLREVYGIKDGIKGRVGAEYFAPEFSVAQQEIAEHKPLVGALAFIVNLATFLLLAF